MKINVELYLEKWELSRVYSKIIYKPDNTISGITIHNFKMKYRPGISDKDLDKIYSAFEKLIEPGSLHSHDDNQTYYHFEGYVSRFKLLK